LLERVLARRGQQEEPPVLALAQQALVERRLKGVEVGAADLLCCLKFEAPNEHAEPGEKVLLGRIQQVVAPGDRGPHCALTGGQVAAAAGQQREALLEPGQVLAL
jgi:hypothetical protein